MKASKAALFASGVFFGGAVDHAILVAMRRDVTPYGVKAGVSGNLLFAVADLIVADVLYPTPHQESKGPGSRRTLMQRLDIAARLVVSPPPRPLAHASA